MWEALAGLVAGAFFLADSTDEFLGIMLTGALVIGPIWAGIKIFSEEEVDFNDHLKTEKVITAPPCDEWCQQEKDFSR